MRLDLNLQTYIDLVFPKYVLRTLNCKGYLYRYVGENAAFYILLFGN